MSHEEWADLSPAQIPYMIVLHDYRVAKMPVKNPGQGVDDRYPRETGIPIGQVKPPWLGADHPYSHWPTRDST